MTITCPVPSLPCKGLYSLAVWIETDFAAHVQTAFLRGLAAQAICCVEAPALRSRHAVWHGRMSQSGQHTATCMRQSSWRDAPDLGQQRAQTHPNADNEL